MKKIMLIVLVSLFCFTVVANAHGPVRGKLKATVTIDASAGEVWAVIKNYDDMSWHPAIASIKAEGGNEKGATRILTLAGGGTITEEMKAYKEGKMSYKYKITDMSTVKTLQHAGQEEKVPVLPVNNYSATLSVKAKGDSSVVSWVAAYYRAYTKNDPPEEMNEESADAAVSKVLTDGLISLRNKFQPGSDRSAVDIKIKR